MAGPWEQYQPQEQPVGDTAGPWDSYAQPPPAPPAGEAPWEEFKAPSVSSSPAPSAMEKGGLVTSARIKRTELEDISKKHGIDASTLASMAPYYGASVEGQFDDLDKQAAGFVSEAAFGLPTFIYKKFQSNPEYRKALDDLNALAQEKKSYLRAGTEMLAPVALTLGAAAPETLGARLGWAAAQGAATGLGESSEEHELGGTALGGAIGAASVPVAAVASKYIVTPIVQSDLVQGLIKYAKKIFTRGAGKVADKAENAAGQEIADSLVEQSKMLSDDVAESLEKKAPILKPRDEVILDAGKRSELSTLESEIGRVSNVEHLAPALERAEQTIEDTKRFAEYLSGGRIEKATGRTGLQSALETVEEVEKTQGKEFLSNQLANFRQIEEAADLMKRANLADYGATRKAFEQLIDGRYKARSIENRLGLPVERAFDNASREYNKYTIMRAVKAQELKPLVNIPLAEDSGPRMVKAIEEGSLAGLSENERSVASGISDLWDKSLKQAQALGIPIEKRANYVRQAALPLDEATARLAAARKGIEQGTGKDLERLSPREFNTLMEQPAFKEFSDSLAYINRKAVNSVEDFTALLRTSTLPENIKQNFSMQAGAAFERKTVVPELIRDTNLFRLYDGWVDNTYKAAYMRGPLEELKKIRNTALQAGLKNDAEYMDRLVTDLTGLRRDTISSEMKLKWMAGRAKARTEAALQGKPYAASMADYGPEALSLMANQVYPAYLGLKPKAIITNLTQPILQTVPELGNFYGTKLATQGYLKAAATKTFGTDIRLTAEGTALLNQRFENAISKGKMPAFKEGQTYRTRNYTDILENQGMRAKQWNTELKDALRSGIESNNVFRLGKEGINKMNDALMYFYEKTESINRFVVKEMAEQMAVDLAKGGAAGKLAQMSIQRGFGKGYQGQIGRALAAGDNKQVANLLTDYMMGRTLFNYNRVNLSEFGRSVGPLFSVFTKFPVSMAGDVYDTLVRKGKVKGGAELFRKYAFPALGTYYLQQAFLGQPNEWDATTKKMLGQEGFAGMAPIGALKSLLTGKVVPPVIDSAAKGVMGVASGFAGDPYPLWKWINQTGKSFAPGARVLEILVDDIPTFMNNEEKQGTLLNKAFPDFDLDERIRESALNK